jgi:CheY-like chemotaxis protein
MADRPRVIVALGNLAESAAVADWLSSEGYEPVQRPSARAATEEMRAHPFDILITDAHFAFRDGLHVTGRVRNISTPTIVVGGAAEEPRGEAINAQTMYLTRPVERAMLVCFVSMAFLDSRPARRSIRKAVNRFDAFVNGLPTRIVDVSNEGMRLEVPPDRRAALPPYFSVRVPLVGVAVTVQRVWTRQSANRASMTWYGGALAQNRTLAEQAWKSFVDTIPDSRGTGVPINF